MQKSKNTFLLLALLSVSASPLVAMSANQQLALAGAAGALGLRVFQAAIADETVTVVSDQYAGYVQRNAPRFKTHQKYLALLTTALLKENGVNLNDLTPRSNAVWQETGAILNTLPADYKESKGDSVLPLRDLVEKLTTPVAPVTKVENKVVLSHEDAQAFAKQLVAQLSKPDEKKGLPTAADAVTILNDLATSALAQDAAVDAAFNTLALAKGYSKLAPLAVPQDETKAEAKA